MEFIEVEKVGWMLFSIQRMKGLADLVAKWMANGTVSVGRPEVLDFALCESLACSYFEVRGDGQALRDEYLGALLGVRRLDQQFYALVAQRERGDFAGGLGKAGRVLADFANAIEKLDYPGAGRDACALRDTAKRCLVLAAP
jgi:hypothetical protein